MLICLSHKQLLWDWPRRSDPRSRVVSDGQLQFGSLIGNTDCRNVGPRAANQSSRCQAPARCPAGASNWGYAPGYPNNRWQLSTPAFAANITLTTTSLDRANPQDIYLDTVSRTYLGGQIPWNADSIQNCDPWTASGWANDWRHVLASGWRGRWFFQLAHQRTGTANCPDAITGQQSWNVYNYTYGIHVQGYSLKWLH